MNSATLPCWMFVQATIGNQSRNSIKEDNISDQGVKLNSIKLKKLVYFVKSRLSKCNRMIDRFKEKHSVWLPSKLITPVYKRKSMKYAMKATLVFR